MEFSLSNNSTLFLFFAVIIVICAVAACKHYYTKAVTTENSSKEQFSNFVNNIEVVMSTDDDINGNQMRVADNVLSFNAQNDHDPFSKLQRSFWEKEWNDVAKMEQSAKKIVPFQSFEINPDVETYSAIRIHFAMSPAYQKLETGIGDKLSLV